MGADRDGLDGLDGADEADRRGFLRSMGRLGGGLAAAGAGLVSVAEGAPEKPTTLQKVKPPQGPGAALSVNGSLQIRRISRPTRRTAPQPLIGEVPDALPATRAQLMQTLVKSGVVRAQGGGEDGGTGSFSVILGEMVRLHTLASAYAEGITLTTTGCEYRGGTYPGRAPLSYNTDQGVLRPELVRGQRVRAEALYEGTQPGEHMWFAIYTPGTREDWLTYTMELCMGGGDGSTIAPHTLLFELNGDEIDFCPTSNGTQLSLVELPGSGATFHYLAVKSERHWLPVEFCWLCVTAL